MASRYVTKKRGKTEVYPFWNLQDIYNMINYFRNKKQWHHYLTFMLGLLLGRRVGDTLSLKWSDLYYDNGKMKNEIVTLEEQKTGKTTTIYVCKLAKEAIQLYISKTGMEPMNNLDAFVFPSSRKNEWINHKKDYQKFKVDEYPKKTIYNWVTFLGKDFTGKRISNIYEDWKKHSREYNNILDYLYEQEFKIAIKSQVAAYQSAFKAAAKYSGIEYNVNTHSTRKSFGYWSKKIHPQDVDSLEILRDIFAHSDSKTTAHYIGLTEERKQKYFEDMGGLIEDVLNGTGYNTKNMPVISLKTDDLRNILTIAISDNNTPKIELFNQLMNLAEERRIV